MPSNEITIGRCFECDFWIQSMNAIWGRCDYGTMNRDWGAIVGKRTGFITSREFGCVHFAYTEDDLTDESEEPQS